MKLLVYEGLSPKLVEILNDLFPDPRALSETASCNYPTAIAAEVLRRNAIRISELLKSRDRLLILDR